MAAFTGSGQADMNRTTSVPNRAFGRIAAPPPRAAL
jgi:hypothetical protein